MGFLDKLKKSSKGSEVWTPPPSGSSVSPQSTPPPSQPFDYSRYPDEKILNPGGYPAHSTGSYTNQAYHQQPQQGYYQPHQQPAYHNQPQHYNPQQPSYQPQHSGYQTSPPPQQHYQQQQQQQQNVTVNLISQSQPQPQPQPSYRPQNNQQGTIPRCDIGHECERYPVKNKQSPNLGRLFWRCQKCNRFVMWDDERVK